MKPMIADHSGSNAIFTGIVDDKKLNSIFYDLSKMMKEEEFSFSECYRGKNKDVIKGKEEILFSKAFKEYTTGKAKEIHCENDDNGFTHFSMYKRKTDDSITFEYPVDEGPAFDEIINWDNFSKAFSIDASSDSGDNYASVKIAPGTDPVPLTLDFLAKVWKTAKEGCMETILTADD